MRSPCCANQGCSRLARLLLVGQIRAPRWVTATQIIAEMSNDVPSSTRARVVIIGCGFGGLEAARALQRAEVDITVIEKTNHHLFQPLLYQVATAGLAAPSIAAPVRLLFRRFRNVTTLLGDVSGIDPAAREVQLRDGSR